MAIVKTKEQKAEEVQNIIDQSTGTEHYYPHFLGLKMTDGVYGVANAAGAHWLVDIVASYQTKPEIKKCGFQVWELKVGDDNKAVVTMKEDKDEPILIKQDIPYTNFPLREFSMWLIDGILILPGEY